MIKKFLLATAIATVLATATYAQTQTSNAPDDRFATAHGTYDGAKNDQCRTAEVETAIDSLSTDVVWMQNWILQMGVLLNSIALSDPSNEMMNRLRDLRNQENALLKRAEFEKEQMVVWLANLRSKPPCPPAPTPVATPPQPPVQPPIQGNTPQPPQVNVPQQPVNPKDDPEPPGTCFTDANAIQTLIKLDPGTVLQQTPAPRWKQQTVGGKCIWYLKYYTINNRYEEGWNIMYTDVPCTDPPPNSSYCPPRSDSTGLYSPGTNDSESQVARSTGADPDNAVDIATPSQPPKMDDKSDAKSDSQSDSKTSDTRRTDSKSDGKSDRSQIKTSADRANAKPASTGEHANVKSEGNVEHTSRTVTNNKSDVSQHVAHGHMGGMHETGMRSGGLGGMHGGGMHGGGLGGLGGGLGGGLAGMLLNNLGGH